MSNEYGNPDSQFSSPQMSPDPTYNPTRNVSLNTKSYPYPTRAKKNLIDDNSPNPNEIIEISSNGIIEISDDVDTLTTDMESMSFDISTEREGNSGF